jgi:uridine kinase
MDKLRDELETYESGRSRFEPVIAEIERLMTNKEKERIIVAIDGKCGSGKSTLGSYLQTKFDCNLFHMDDFFLQDHQRVAKRLKEAGGNVDYERFSAEVLKPLISGSLVKYRVFNCSTRVIDREYEIHPKKLNIVEGSYSQHPYFESPYDLCIFLDIDASTQIENIKMRNGLEKLELFRQKWIPMENRYFDQFNIKQKSMIVDWK